MWWRRAALALNGMGSWIEKTASLLTQLSPSHQSLIRATTPRSRVETAIGRYRQVIGDGLRFRKDEGRQTEVAVAAYVLNRMSGLGPSSS
jgi:hypothetical protein